MVQPEDGIKRRIIDNTHMAILASQYVKLTMNTFKAVEKGWAGLRPREAIVGERFEASSLSEQVVGTVAESQTVVV